MKAKYKNRSIALGIFSLALPALLFALNPNAFWVAAMMFMISLIFMVYALIPAALAMVIPGRRNFLFAWLGTLAGGFLGLCLAGLVEWALNPADWVTGMAFCSSVLTGAVFGGSYRGAPGREGADLGYEESEGLMEAEALEMN